jgi:hypothetical protein
MRLKHHPTSAFAAMLIALAAVGCGSSSSTTASKTSAAVSSQRTQSVQTASQPQGATSNATVAGYGSNEAAWNAAHTPANDYPSGSAYDSDPSLPEVEGHAAARYTGVHREGGRIVAYDYHFPSAPIASAQRNILGSQFPTDARLVWFTVKPTCAVMLLRSDTLRRQLSAAVGHAAGMIKVQFNSAPEANSYDASAVTVAALAPAVYKSPAEAEC